MSFFGHRLLLPSAIIVPWALLLLFVLSGFRHSFAAAPYTFYYFHPDSVQSNLVRLKGEMDIFLNQAELSVTFTPFARFNDFDRLTKNKPPCLAFLPKWYLEQDNHQEFTPLLEPLHDGSTNYHKLLLTRSQSDISLTDLKRRTLATTSFGPQGENLLDLLLFDKHNIKIKDLNIVITPKDSDALFALALGQVDLALVSKSNLDRISSLNPQATRSFRTLSKTKPIPMPILCYRKGSISAEYIEKIKQVFLQATRKTDNIMEMLQIDAWQLSTSS